MSKKRTGLRLLVVLIGLLFIVGAGLLFAAHELEKASLAHDISRDLGIAFLISALVTVAYEAYARTRFDLEKVESLLDTLYGSGLPAGVWESIKETLLKRELIRRGSVLSLRVVRDPLADAGHVVLEVEFSYSLANLLSKGKRYEVVHGLDEHITGRDLPRFTGASIGAHYEKIEHREGMPWKSRDEKVDMSVTKDGRLKLGVDLPAAGENREVPLLIERREVRSCPGSYYLIMTELTDGLRIVLREGAEDVNVEVTFRPSERNVNLTERRVEIIDEPLLPGHCVEFKLTPAKATGV